MTYETESQLITLSKSEQKAVEERFREHYGALAKRIDRLFATLMLAQWFGAVMVAWLVSPLAWEGRESSVHVHIYAAIGLGGLITALPVYLANRAPGQPLTRYVIGVAQVLWSALLIHLTGGRIEAHFHVFCSLAVLSFYRDFRVLIPSTAVVAIDHFVRGLYWPESVYGVSNPEWWRFLEHAGWVVFLDLFLFQNCIASYRELWALSHQQVQLELAKDSGTKMERMATIGQLAASVGHELKSPLTSIAKAQQLMRKRLGDEMDVRVRQFLDSTEAELETSQKIISNLMEFSRPRDPVRAPCALYPLVDEAIEQVAPPKAISVINAVPKDLPDLHVDRAQFRQVLANLLENAVQAIRPGQDGRVMVRAEATSDMWKIHVEDNGPGIPSDIIEKIFQPLFSTKVRGTGLGLAVVKNMVERHEGSLRVNSVEGKGASFRVELPRAKRRAA